MGRVHGCFNSIDETKFLEMLRICLRIFVCITSKQIQIQKHTKIYLASANLSSNGMQRFTNAWKSSCNFLSVLLLGCQI